MYAYSKQNLKKSHYHQTDNFYVVLKQTVPYLSKVAPSSRQHWCHLILLIARKAHIVKIHN